MIRIVSCCNDCGNVTREYLCDTCGISIPYIPFLLQGRYKSSIDMQDYHFCSWQCLQEFVNAEFDKEKAAPQQED